MNTARGWVPFALAACLWAACDGVERGAPRPEGALGVDSHALAIGCPGTEPPPRDCEEVCCDTYDDAWDFSPLPVGTPCQGTGLCDGHRRCTLPPPGKQTLMISPGDLDTIIRASLDGSILSVDGTGDAPPIVTGYHTDCVDGPETIGITCTDIAETRTSYIRFSGDLESYYTFQTGQHLADFGFDTGFFCEDTMGICATVNRIQGDLGTTTATFREDDGGVEVDLVIPLESPSPTVFMDFPLPDLDLVNMKLTVQLDVVASGDRTSLAVANVDVIFDFDSNPDAFSPLGEAVDERIRSEVHDQLTSALQSPARRDALSRVLTKAVEGYAESTVSNWSGFGQVGTVSVVNGTLLIDHGTCAPEPLATTCAGEP